MNRYWILLILTCSLQAAYHCGDDRPITIAILAKDKAHTLPLFLKCLETQTWPKEKTHLYIRTNNNNDNTQEILSRWLDAHKHEYLSIYFDDTDTPEQVQRFGQHEWNCERFKVLGRIRQESVQWAYQKNSHYCVIDCDNFIFPETIEAIATLGLPVVAPLLIGKNFYSNYHSDVDANGYYKDSPFYFPLRNRELVGIVQMPVVHCTYFIRYEYLPNISYDDESYRYEYVIFSDVLRKQNIPQYLDTRQVYGYMTPFETFDEYKDEYWMPSFAHLLEEK